MVMQRLLPDKLGRILHDQLFNRLVSFAENYTPEFPAELFATLVLKRFYEGDENLHIVVEIDDRLSISGHAVLDIQEAFGVKVLTCYQFAHDKANLAKMEPAIEYLVKLANETGASSIKLDVAKNSSVYKKYGFEQARTVLLRNMHEDS